MKSNDIVEHSFISWELIKNEDGKLIERYGTVEKAKSRLQELEHRLNYRK